MCIALRTATSGLCLSCRRFPCPSPCSLCSDLHRTQSLDSPLSPQTMEACSPVCFASSSQALTAGASGHEPQSFSPLHLCSFCGNLVSNCGLAVAAGKCTAHPSSTWKAFPPHPTVTQRSISSDLWFTGNSSDLVCHLTGTIRQQLTYYFTFVPAWVELESY